MFISPRPIDILKEASQAQWSCKSNDCREVPDGYTVSLGQHVSAAIQSELCNELHFPYLDKHFTAIHVATSYMYM